MYTGGGIWIFCKERKKKKPADEYDFCLTSIDTFSTPWYFKGAYNARIKYNHTILKEYKPRYFFSRSFTNITMLPSLAIQNLEPRIDVNNDRAPLRSPVLPDNAHIWM
jgi:hypothetical protein